MAKLKAQFRPIQEELPASNSPDGICLDTLNTVTDGNSVLGGRKGFDAFDLNTGAFGEILNMFVATFSDGDVYLITKRVDGKLYQMKQYPVAASVWTAIADKWSNHSTTDRGWFYMYADRMVYVDRKGGTKWYPHATDADAGTTYKAGIEATVSPTIAAESGGGKEGYYHLGYANVNQRTGEESDMMGLQGNVETRLSPATGGGINITNWKNSGAGIADKTSDQNYEYDALRLYCTLGNTEHSGLGAGSEQFSYQLFQEVLVLKSVAGATFAPVYRTDQIISRNPQLANRGGQPPGSLYGCYNGSQAIYLKVYPKAKDSPTLTNLGNFTTEAPDILMYSVPGYPQSVPQVRTYDIGGINDRKNFVPRGGAHEIPSSISGLITGCGSIGNSFIVFTNSSTYSMSPNAQGHMRPRIADSAHGAIGANPVVSTGSSVHAFGKDTWLRIGSGGIQNVAHETFTPTMQEIPDAGITATVGGYYSHKNQVWFAVAKTGGTAAKAQRILIFDEGLGGLVSKFDPGNLGTAGVSAMIELSHPKQTPVMLVALDTGVILKWPGTNYTDAATDGGSAVAYACNWRGLFGQSKRGDRLKMSKIRTSMETTPAAGVTLRVAGIQNAAQAAAATGTTKLIPIATNEPAETRLDTGAAVDFDPNANGRMFAVEYLSTAQQGADWKVGDVIMEITRT